MLRLKTLGSPVIEGSGGPLPGAATQRKPLALLALLAVANERGLSRDKILAYLWPEADAEKAGHRLNQLLYALRRDLGSDNVFLGSSDLRLNPEVLTTDVGEFTAAIRRREFGQAAAVYEGPFLDGFYLDGALEFERWMEEERADLAKGYGSALEAVAAATEKRGDLAAAVEWRRKLVRLDPLDAQATLRLMDVLHAAGDSAGALQVAQSHEALITEELDTKPNPAIRALGERIRCSGESTRGPDSSSSGSSQLATSAKQQGGPADGVVRDGEAVRVGRPKSPWWPWMVPAAGAGLAVLAVAALIASAHRGHTPRLDARRVVVEPLENRTGDGALDFLGPIASDWITRVLSESHLVEVVDASTAFVGSAPVTRPPNDSALSQATPPRADLLGAGTVITGSYYRQGDSLYFQATVVDQTTRNVLASLGPHGAPVTQPLPAIEQLRQRVAAALANHIDPQIKELSGVSEPPTYESYRHYVEGNRLNLLGEYRRALRQYAEATTQDPSFHAPLVLAALAHFDLGLTETGSGLPGGPAEFAVADSLAQELSAYRDQLTKVENLLLDWLLAHLGGYSQTALQVSRQLAHLLPGTTMQYMAGFDAYWANRPHEAVQTLRSMDPNRGLMRFGSIYYWWVLTSSYHLLGQHTEELTAAEAARRSYGATWDVLYLEMRALAALQRVPELNQRLKQTEGLAPNFSLFPPGLVLTRVALELRAHGNGDEGQKVLARALAWYRGQPPPDNDWRRARFGDALYLNGDWTAAREVFAKLAAENPSDWGYRGMLGLTAARLGNSAAAARIMDTLALVKGGYLFGQVAYAEACIASVLGWREKAVAFLHRAYGEGLPGRDALHTDPDMDSLRDFPPFQQLLQPED